MGFVMSFTKNLIGGLAAMSVMVGAASATPITIAGQTFDDANLADFAGLSAGTSSTYDLDGGPDLSFSDALTDGDINTGGRCVTDAGAPGCSFAVFFDGGIENQGGDDLQIFGIGVGQAGVEVFDVVINGVRVSGLELVNTGMNTLGFAISSLSLDLADFGVAAGDVVNAVSIIVSSVTNPEEFSEFVSLNDAIATPIPAAFLIFLGGAAGLFGASRKKKTA